MVSVAFFGCLFTSKILFSVSTFNNGKKFHAFSFLAYLKFGGKILCLWLNADKIEK